MAVSLQVFREPVYRIIEPVTRWLIRNRVHPNLITTLGCLATLAAAWLYHSDNVRTAGLLVLLGGVADIFDGRVARESGLASKFGSFYDSTLEPESRDLRFPGLLSCKHGVMGRRWRTSRNGVCHLPATSGSLMVSYTRFPAEAMDSTARSG